MLGFSRSCGVRRGIFWSKNPSTSNRPCYCSVSNYAASSNSGDWVVKWLNVSCRVFPGPNLCRRSLPSCVPTATRSTSSPTAAQPSALSASSSPCSLPRTSTFAQGWASEACPRPSCLCPPSPASWRSPRASDCPVGLLSRHSAPLKTMLPHQLNPKTFDETTLLLQKKRKEKEKSLQHAS